MGLEPRTGQLCALLVYSYLHLRLLGTPVDKRWVLLACKNKLCDPQRHSFHFEQVSFQYMLPRLSYQRAKKCRRTDRQTDGFSALYSRLASVPALSCRCIYDLAYLVCYTSQVYLVCCSYLPSFAWLVFSTYLV